MALRAPSSTKNVTTKGQHSPLFKAQVDTLSEASPHSIGTKMWEIIQEMTSMRLCFRWTKKKNINARTKTAAFITIQVAALLLEEAMTFTFPTNVTPTIHPTPTFLIPTELEKCRSRSNLENRC